MSLLLEAVLATARTQAERVRTTYPGYVVSYDRTMQTADVQIIPRMRRRDPDTDAVTFVRVPVIPNVPVRFDSGTGWSFVGDLSAGDPVVVHVCACSIDEWRQTGRNDTEPQVPRRWDFTDAFAEPGGRPNADPLPSSAYAAGAAVLRSSDVRLGSSSATDFVALASLVSANFTALATALGPYITAYNVAVAAANSSGLATPVVITVNPGDPVLAFSPSSVAATKVKAE